LKIRNIESKDHGNKLQFERPLILFIETNIAQIFLAHKVSRGGLN